MRKALVLALVVVAAAGCGTKIDATDKQVADTFFDAKSRSSQEALCEGLETAAGRKDGVDAVSQALGAPTEQDYQVAGYGTAEERQRALDKIASSMVNSKEITERAESIVNYLHNDRC